MPAIVPLTSELSGYAMRFASSSLSDDGRALWIDLQSIQQRNRGSEVLSGSKLQAEAALLDLLDAHREASYQAEPVIPGAVRVAVQFVRAMPFDLTMPEFDVEPEGCVVLDWTVARRVRLGISIGQSDRLALSWMSGADCGNAVYRFDGCSIPEDVVTAIRRIALHEFRIRSAGHGRGE